jgi:hypothetical protein
MGTSGKGEHTLFQPGREAFDKAGGATYIFQTRNVAGRRPAEEGDSFMLKLTENARKELEAYFAGRERGTIRVYLASG